MKKKSFIYSSSLVLCLLVLIFITLRCKAKVSFFRVKLNDMFTIDSSFIDRNVESSYDSQLNVFNFGSFSVEFESGYHCNNFYEYDLLIVHPSDTIQINNLSKENIDFIIAENKNKIDLDYHRKSNVFFDTLLNLPCKIIEPRQPFKGDYIYYFDSIGDKQKSKLNQCMYFKTNQIKNLNDLNRFRNFVKSIDRVSN